MPFVLDICARCARQAIIKHIPLLWVMSCRCSMLSTMQAIVIFCTFNSINLKWFLLIKKGFLSSFSDRQLACHGRVGLACCMRPSGAESWRRISCCYILSPIRNRSMRFFFPCYIAEHCSEFVCLDRECGPFVSMEVLCLLRKKMEFENVFEMLFGVGAQKSAGWTSFSDSSSSLRFLWCFSGAVFCSHVQPPRFCASQINPLRNFCQWQNCWPPVKGFYDAINDGIRRARGPFAHQPQITNVVWRRTDCKRGAPMRNKNVKVEKEKKTRNWGVIALGRLLGCIPFCAWTAEHINNKYGRTFDVCISSVHS